MIRWRRGVVNMQKPGTSSWRWHELRRAADSGICRRPISGVTCEDIHEPTKKQIQCCPKKSGFWVWTSGRFVNMLDEKDILVCVHTRNIPWAWGCFWYVKVPSSPYKRGHEGTCKRIQTFGNLSNLQRESQSLCTLTLCLNVLRTLSLSLSLSRVRGIIRIFRVTPQHWRPPCSSRGKAHDATSEEIQVEHSRRGKSRWSPSYPKEWNLFRSWTF
jgi:hypothetical protein